MRPTILLLAALLSAAGLLGAGEAEGIRAMDRGDFATAVKEFTALAGAGDAKAMTQVALFYYEGQGVDKDPAKAMDWFLKAKDQEPDAFVSLGVMHRDGLAVPQNRKIAYCVFLAARGFGLGGEETQDRVRSLLRRITPELSVEELKDCLSNYTLEYVNAYLEAKGAMSGIPGHLKPSAGRPAFKDLGLWPAEKLDVLFGKASLPDLMARKKQAKRRRTEEGEAQRTLVLQAMCSGLGLDRFRSSALATDGGVQPLAFSANTAAGSGTTTVHDATAAIAKEQRRFVAFEDLKGERTLVYEIGLPALPPPCGWSDWQAPVYALKEGYELFGLCDGREPESKVKEVPADAPRIRFKVVKERQGAPPLLHP